MYVVIALFFCPLLQVQVAVPKITVTLEEQLDRGAHGAAFKLLVTDLNSSVENWSSDVRGSASLSLQAAYFNKRFDVWEYLVEPLELENREFQSWTMTAEVRTSVLVWRSGH